MDSLVSIVTVCYNAETEVEDTIQSVIKQTYQQIEYIIIDGASTDRTLEMVKPYEAHIQRIISEPDGGIYFAMNKGMEIARGEWVMFMNAGDTFVNENAVSALVTAADSSSHIVFGKSWTCFNGHKKLRFPNFNLHKQDWYLSKMPNHQSVLVPKQIYGQLRFDTSYKVFADTVFLRKAFQDCEVSEAKEVISHFHLGGKSNYYPKWKDFQMILHDTQRIRKGKGSRMHYIKWMLQIILPKNLYLTIYIKFLLG